MSQRFAVPAICPSYMSQPVPHYVPNVLSVLSMSYQCPISVPSMSYDNTGVVYLPGCGPLIVIFGAIIVMRNGNTNKLFGEVIPNSLLIWDPSIKPPSSRGRKRTNADA